MCRRYYRTIIYVILGPLTILYWKSLWSAPYWPFKKSFARIGGLRWLVINLLMIVSLYRVLNWTPWLHLWLLSFFEHNCRILHCILSQLWLNHHVLLDGRPRSSGQSILIEDHDRLTPLSLIVWHLMKRRTLKGRYRNGIIIECS